MLRRIRGGQPDRPGGELITLEDQDRRCGIGPIGKVSR